MELKNTQKNLNTPMDLLVFLLQTYPEQTPRVKQSEWEQGYNAGIMSVIDFLKSKLNYQGGPPIETK